MYELEYKIYDAIDPLDDRFELTDDELDAIKLFISKCSIADFEKLKELDYDLSTAKNESDDTAQ